MIWDHTLKLDIFLNDWISFVTGILITQTISFAATYHEKADEINAVVSLANTNSTPPELVVLIFLSALPKGTQKVLTAGIEPATFGV